MSYCSFSKLVRLSEIVHVQPGYLSRSSVDSVPDGTHHLLQAKDVATDGGVRLGNAVRFHPERKPELYQVSRGDVLVTARGQNHRAYYVDQDLADVLASATFYILRPDVSRILPSYLAWWLNLPGVQSAIDSASRGTDIGYISRLALENLRVQVPTLTVQRRIERVLALWHERESIRLRIDEKRKQHIQTVCQRAVQGTNEKEQES